MSNWPKFESVYGTKFRTTDQQIDLPLGDPNGNALIGKESRSVSAVLVTPFSPQNIDVRCEPPELQKLIKVERVSQGGFLDYAPTSLAVIVSNTSDQGVVVFVTMSGPAVEIM